MMLKSAIYEGLGVHERVRPKHHRLRYKVFSLLLDIDELDVLDAKFRLFAHNRWAPLAFFDRDHGPTDGTPLRPWVQARLKEVGLDISNGAIRLLCYPRVFGYVFNPLSVYFCYNESTHLQAILYEVCNTYKERHTYIIPVDEGDRNVICQHVQKSMYVSPFISMDSTYHFRILPPAAETIISIRQEDCEGPFLVASFAGKRKNISGETLVKTLLRFPFLTFKIIAGIHWEALRLWLKGIRLVVYKPAAQSIESSIGQSKPSEN